MDRLRGPDGCPWDRAQNYDSLKGLLLEEAYEVVDAVNARDFSSLEDELGDLLFQVVFYSRLAEEEGRFTIEAVIDGVHAKLVRRHPHVFGEKRARTPEEALESWNTVKQQEREARLQALPHNAGRSASVLDGIPRNLPSTLEAYELGTRAAEAEFDWARVEDLLDKIAEEFDELRRELQRSTARATATSLPQPEADPAHSADSARVEEEVGDLLFAVANVARFVGSDPESCLRHANQKFGRRFRALEGEIAKRGKRVRDCDAKELDEIWNTVKKQS